MALLGIALISGPIESGLAQEPVVPVDVATSAEAFGRRLDSDDRAERDRAYSELHCEREGLIPVFTLLLRHPSVRVRFAAVLAFYTLKNVAVEKALRIAMKDTDAVVREYAYDGLMLQGPHTLPWLREYVDGLEAPILARSRLGPYWTGGKGLGGFDWSPDGSSLAIGIGGGAVVVADRRSSAQIRRLALGRQVGSLRWSPDGRSIVTAGGGLRSGFILLWSLGRNEWSEPDGLWMGTTDVSWAADSKRLAFGRNRRLIVVNLDGDEILNEDIGDEVYDLSFAPNGRSVALCTESGRVVIAEDGRIERLGDDIQGDHVSWAPDGERLLCTTQRSAALVSLRTRSVVWRQSGERAYSQGGGEFSPDGSQIVLVKGSRIEFADPATGRALRSMEHESLSFHRPAWCPLGRRVAVGDNISNVWIVDSLPAAPPSSGEGIATLAESLWEAMESEDPDVAGEAEETIARAGGAGIDFVASRVRPVQATTEAEVRALLKKTTNGGEDGEAARRRLERLGAAAASFLGTAGMRELVESPEDMQIRLHEAHVSMREMRALATLVRTRDPAGKRLLKSLAGGQKGAPLTELARVYLRLAGMADD